jgi:hypothetical protein
MQPTIKTLRAKQSALLNQHRVNTPDDLPIEQVAEYQWLGLQAEGLERARRAKRVAIAHNARAKATAARHEQLVARQRRALQLLALGKRPAEVARIIGVNVRRVYAYRFEFPTPPDVPLCSCCGAVRP